MSIEALKKTLNIEKKLVMAVRIRPNAESDKLVGFLSDGSVKIGVRAPAVDGKANLAVVKFLAAWLEVNEKNITIMSGETSRRKLVKIEL